MCMKLDLNAQGAAASADTSSLELQYRRTKFHRFLIRSRRNWQLHMLVFLPLLYLCIWDFYPLYGQQIAFREFKPRAGIWASEWVGIKHIIDFWNAPNFLVLLKNTVFLASYQLAIGFPVPIILALFLHICPSRRYAKLVQNTAYIPHFISTVVLVGLMDQMLNPVSGLYGTIYELMGGVGYATDIRSMPGSFRHMYVWSGVWQNMGWSTIIYCAALAGVSQELHEAAELDGATRLARVFHVDLPAILPTICILLIMRFAGIMSVGHAKVYLMQNDLNLSTSEVISTYVYKTGIGQMRLSFGTAVGMWNSLIHTVLLLIVNKITNWLSDGENGLF